MGVIFIFMATPGLGVLSVVSRAISSGFKHAIFMSIGMVLGDIIFLLLSIFGLGMIATSFSTLFILIKIIGGIYLIFFGLKIFMAKTSHFDTALQKNSTLFLDFSSGLFITLSNPKVIAFYVGFLPAFIDLSKLNNKDVALVSFLVLVILSSILFFYAYFASKAKELIKKAKIQMILNRTTGAIIVLVGCFLILGHL